MITAFLILLAAQVASKDVFDFPSRSYPVGTTVTASFVVPETNTGMRKVSIPCIDNVQMTVQLESKTGANYGRFVRSAEPCGGVKTIFVQWPGGKSIPKGTELQIRITVDKAISRSIQVEMEKQ